MAKITRMVLSSMTESGVRNYRPETTHEGLLDVCGYGVDGVERPCRLALEVTALDGTRHRLALDADETVRLLSIPLSRRAGTGLGDLSDLVERALEAGIR